MRGEVAKKLRKATKEKFRLLDKQCQMLGLNKNDSITNLGKALKNHFKGLNNQEKSGFIKLLDEFLLLNLNS